MDNQRSMAHGLSHRGLVIWACHLGKSGASSTEGLRGSAILACSPSLANPCGRRLHQLPSCEANTRDTSPGCLSSDSTTWKGALGGLSRFEPCHVSSFLLVMLLKISYCHLASENLKFPIRRVISHTESYRVMMDRLCLESGS